MFKYNITKQQEESTKKGGTKKPSADKRLNKPTTITKTSIKPANKPEKQKGKYKITERKEFF